MSKENYSARVEDGLDDGIQQFKESRGINEDSEAVRQLLRRGLEAAEGGESATLQVTHLASLVSFLGAVMAALMAVAFSWDVRLLAMAATFAFASILFSASTVSVFGSLRLLGRGDTS